MFKLLSLAGKPVGTISDAELDEAAKLIGGGDNPVLAEFFRTIRSAEPNTPVTELLRSPTAMNALQSFVDRRKAANDDEERDVYCRCPRCNFGFITTL